MRDRRLSHVVSLIALFLSACLPIIHEQERDLSSFETFELDHSEKSGLHYRITEQEDGAYAMTVRFENEFVLERTLAAGELRRLRDVSKHVVLQTVFDDGEPCCSDPAWILYIRWDDIRADTWRGYDSQYAIDENTVEQFFNLLESFRKAETS